jgi:hypothetical protein
VNLQIAASFFAARRKPELSISDTVSAGALIKVARHLKFILKKAAKSDTAFDTTLVF